MTLRVLISCRHLQDTFERYESRFRARSIEVDLPRVRQHLSEEELLPIIGRYHGLIAGDDELTAAVLERAENLAVVSRWGVGVDNVDREYAARAGIAVTNTPGVFAEEVADVALGYLILLARGLHRIDRAVRRGEWLKVRGTSLAGKTLGVVGIGSIGRAVAARAEAIGMRVLGVDRERQDVSFRQVESLEELLPEADFVSLHCDLNPSTRALIGASEVALMKPGAYVVNTSRGRVIDEAALVEGLRSGRLAGAALDVFESEPLDPSHPLASREQVILGSHNASNTLEAVLRTNELAIDNLMRHLPEDGS